MSDTIVLADRIGKSYRLTGKMGGYRTLRESITDVVLTPFRAAKNLFGRSDGAQPGPEIFWALRDISFEVKRGDVLGVIGRNGAGKSTLLKILSRITEPTEGYAEVRGRVGSLLEVGTGFHPELSGRENIFLNGAILGMKKVEIARKFDEIVEFGEVAKFIDMPVKHYSSGMYLRLAFAVAAHLEPEILIVDEVLAVGDFRFQKKCLGKMKQVSGEGRTVLFVSHNLTAVRNLCRRTLLLDRGRVILEGPTDAVLNHYTNESDSKGTELNFMNVESAPGNEKARLLAVRLLNSAGRAAGQFPREESLQIEIEYAVLVPKAVLNLSLSLFAQDDVYVFASPSSTDSDWYQKEHPKGRYKSICTIPGSYLNVGLYSVTVLLVESGSHVVAQLDRAVSFETIDIGASESGHFGYWGGVVRPRLSWSTSKSSD